MRKYILTIVAMGICVVTASSQPRMNNTKTSESPIAQYAPKSAVSVAAQGARVDLAEEIKFIEAKLAQLQSIPSSKRISMVEEQIKIAEKKLEEKRKLLAKSSLSKPKREKK